MMETKIIEGRVNRTVSIFLFFFLPSFFNVHTPLILLILTNMLVISCKFSIIYLLSQENGLKSTNKGKKMHKNTVILTNYW